MKDMDFDLYDFIKDNYSLSSNVLFQQHMYNSRYEFKDYLQNFILSKAKKPLRSLDLYFCGRKDLCIQSIELNGMHQDFQNDHELYQFLSTMMFSPEEINQAENFLAFLNRNIESLHAEFNDLVLINDSNELRRFQQQIEIFCSEL